MLDYHFMLNGCSRAHTHTMLSLSVRYATVNFFFYVLMCLFYGMYKQYLIEEKPHLLNSLILNIIVFPHRDLHGPRADPA